MKYLALKFSPLSEGSKDIYGLVIENYLDLEFGVRKPTNLLVYTATNPKHLGKVYCRYMLLPSGNGNIKEPVSFSNPFDIFRNNQYPERFYETKEFSKREKLEFKEGLLEFLEDS